MRSTTILAASLWLISCGGQEVSETRSNGAVQSGTAAVADADWQALVNSKVIFGHQSVGGNILEGLRELNATRAARPVAIVSSRDSLAGSNPGLVEFRIGENGEPEKKMADFAASLDRVGDSTGAVAIFKYCYLDITPDTDVRSLFAKHREAVRAMRAKHPGLTFVHVTAPLTALEPAPKLLVKRLLGKKTSKDANARRNEFNALLLQEYAGEPIFDLARVESTRPDGSRSFFTAAGDTVYTLAPELTNDGGHLNEAGRRAAAAELVSVIAKAAGGPR